MELAKIYRSPEDFCRRIDRLLMYLGRYGNQQAVSLETKPTAVLISWADEVHQFLKEEARQIQEAKR